MALVPYRFEPEQEEDSEGSEIVTSESEIVEELSIPTGMINNTSWCQCGACQMMSTEEECVCCHEIPQDM